MARGQVLKRTDPDATAIGNEVLFCQRVLRALARKFVTVTIRKALDNVEYSHWHSSSSGAMTAALCQFDKNWAELEGWGLHVLPRHAYIAVYEAFVQFPLSVNHQYDDEARNILRRINEFAYETLYEVVESSAFGTDTEPNAGSVIEEFATLFRSDWNVDEILASK